MRHAGSNDRQGRSSVFNKRRLLGWWYLCIGAGFALLGFSRLLKGEVLWLSGLRWVLAVGFIALAYLELRSRE
jgi:hypothetical protein